MEDSNDVTNDVNSDDDDSSELLHPLFMTKLPRDFTNNHHLSALASFITTTDHDDDDDDNNDHQTMQSHHLALHNEKDREDHGEQSDDHIENHGCHTGCMITEVNDQDDIPVMVLPVSTTHAPTTQSNHRKVICGRYSNGKVRSVNHLKSRQQQQSPYKRYQSRNDGFIEKKTHNSASSSLASTSPSETKTTFSEAQLYLKMWKL